MWVLSRCYENISFSYRLQGRNLLVDNQNFKRGEDIKKREDQISRGGGLFFLFYQSKLMSHFVHVIPVSPDITLKRDAKDKVNDCLVVLNTMTCILEEF